MAQWIYTYVFRSNFNPSYMSVKVDLIYFAFGEIDIILLDGVIVFTFHTNVLYRCH